MESRKSCIHAIDRIRPPLISWAFEYRYVEVAAPRLFKCSNFIMQELLPHLASHTHILQNPNMCSPPFVSTLFILVLLGGPETNDPGQMGPTFKNSIVPDIVSKGGTVGTRLLQDGVICS